MLKAYFAKSVISSKIVFAIFAEIPFLTQPGTLSPRPFMKFSLSFAITSAFFLDIARRTISLRPRE